MPLVTKLIANRPTWESLPPDGARRRQPAAQTATLLAAVFAIVLAAFLCLGLSACGGSDASSQSSSSSAKTGAVDAEQLHQGAVEAERANQRGVVDVETLQQVNDLPSGSVWPSSLVFVVFMHEGRGCSLGFGNQLVYPRKLLFHSFDLLFRRHIRREPFRKLFAVHTHTLCFFLLPRHTVILRLAKLKTRSMLAFCTGLLRIRKTARPKHRTWRHCANQHPENALSTLRSILFHLG